MYELQHTIELTYGKQHIKDVVLKEIDPASKIVQSIIDKINIYRHKTYSYKSKNVRVKSLRPSSIQITIDLIIAVITVEEVVTPVQVVISKLLPHLQYVSVLDGVKTAGEILAVCEGELYSLYHNTDYENATETLGIKPNFQISQETRDFINNAKYLPPMLCKPVKWKGNYGYGHLTGSKSLVLGSTKSTQTQNLDTINTLQDIEWELNEDILEFMEISKKALDTPEKKENFNRMCNTSEQVYQGLLDQGNKFYFVWKYDFRGRSYCQGYHVNLQGNSYRKAIINFKHKELLTNEVIL